ncbi:class I SAM-dependent methyltransferase [Desulfovermiculus halophilus]|jgi:16S rRNA (guanine1516-N2)-methyltransferase|uniref:class I SAM-dependent methyltransferase n=1 Tax=Desulfovermiculus halophilus TaxID=339722 RepID=UPI0006847CAE|nr:class I SAM-dependent methyltransferase [Desulfovermiculus halophilus]
MEPWDEEPFALHGRGTGMELPGSRVQLTAPAEGRGLRRLWALAAELDLGPVSCPDSQALSLEVTAGELKLNGPLPGEGSVRTNPVRSDLPEVDGAAAQGSRGIPLLRAVLGRNKAKGRVVLDVTGGLGRDAWLLAGSGCSVVVVEQVDAVFALLRDGVARAGVNAQTTARRMRLIHASGEEVMGRILGSVYPGCGQNVPRPHVVYMDPFFHSERKRKGTSKRFMQVLRYLGRDAESNADELLRLGLQTAGDRVVVKRPRICAPMEPGIGQRLHCIQGRGYRFDIYQRSRS